MEDRVYAHVRWELEAEGATANLLKNLERTQASRFELVGGSIRSDVRPDPLRLEVGAEEPNTVAFLEAGLNLAQLVGIIGMVALSFADSRLRFFVDLSKASDVLLRVRDLRVLEGDREPRMVAIIGQEGRHADG